jgi:2-C-methyl-D-erythritol 4-phosphate cytidylyltransferase
MQLQTPVSLVAGGVERQASVYNGLTAVIPGTEYVAIHDGVRPFIQPEMIEACLDGARQTGACILGVPLTDTLKQVNMKGIIETTLSRHSMWRAQTPQAFSYKLIRDAHERARQKGVTGTDDAELLEKAGHPIKIINGSGFNLKITTPDDLKLAEIIWNDIQHG